MLNKKCLIIVLFIFTLMFSGCKFGITEEITQLAETTKVVVKVEEKKAEGSIEKIKVKAETQPLIKEDIRTISILGTGDIMSHMDNLRSAYIAETGDYSYVEPFKYVKQYIEEVDFAIGNLETVTAGAAAKYTSFPRFNTPETILDALKYAGFDMLITATNHSIDREKEGIIKTIDEIEARGLIYNGTHKNPESRVTYREVNGFILAVSSYTYGCNGNLQKLTAEEQSYSVNLLIEENIKNDIFEAKEKDVDIIIIYMHWGVEYERVPRIYQEEMAERIFEYGADIIFGTHPHVIQKSEILNINGEDKYIIYSMGNYYSNFRRTDTIERPNRLYTEDGVMPIITFQKDFEDKASITKLIKVKHIPTWVDKYYENGKPVYYILPIPNLELDWEYISDRNQAYVRMSYENTFEKVKDY